MSKSIASLQSRLIRAWIRHDQAEERTENGFEIAQSMGIALIGLGIAAALGILVQGLGENIVNGMADALGL